jgi:hypothetical protein
MYKLKVDVPSLEKGAVLTIDGIGEVENGKTVTIDEDTATAFRVAHAKQVGEYDEDGNMTIDTVLGPTLLEANLMEGITVEKVSKPKSETTKQKEGDS